MIYIAAVLTLMAGCTLDGDVDSDTDTQQDTDTGTVPKDPLIISGTWADNWGSVHLIDSNLWLWDENQYIINSYHNEDRWVIAQNDFDNSFFGGLWSRFDWTLRDDQYWYCHATFDAASQSEALERPAADPSQPQDSGCGGFAWSTLLSPLDIRGTYVDTNGSVHSISETRWSIDENSLVFNVDTFDNDTATVIAQNDPNNTTHPGRWSRFDWTVQNEILYTCHTAKSESSAENAGLVPQAYTTSPDSSGCNGTPWLILSRMN